MSNNTIIQNFDISSISYLHNDIMGRLANGWLIKTMTPIIYESTTIQIIIVYEKTKTNE